MAFLTLLLLSACQPLQTGGIDPAMPIVITDQQNSATTAVEDGQVVLDIQSETGIGSAEITTNSHGTKVNQSEILVRLHVAVLEEFRMAYDNVLIVASVSSSNKDLVIQSVQLGEDPAEPISEVSPFWLDIGMLTASGKPATMIPNRDGHFEIALPANIVNSDSETVSISWIDFYR